MAGQRDRCRGIRSRKSSTVPRFPVLPKRTAVCGISATTAGSIHTSAEDATLHPDERRFVKAGSPVWERGVRRSPSKDSPSAKIRRAALADCDYQCAVCGIAAGENYPDAPHIVAILAASRRTVRVDTGRVETMFVSECKRAVPEGGKAAVTSQSYWRVSTSWSRRPSRICRLDRPRQARSIGSDMVGVSAPPCSRARRNPQTTQGKLVGTYSGRSTLNQPPMSQGQSTL